MDHEMDDEDWGSPVSHMIAGAIAGTTEHCGMFPIDTIKTHIQAYQLRPVGAVAGTAAGSVVQGNTIWGVFRSITHQRGVKGLFRGLSAMITGAAPAHAVYFAVYEMSKQQFGGNQQGHHPVATFAAGVLATVASDAVLTPMDSIKQKMQLGVRSYSGLIDCVRHTYRSHGLLKGFYSAYTTTLFMNVPYSGTYFASYEFFKKILHPDDSDPDLHESPLNYCLAGGGAGVVSAAFTNPLDVAKTRLQTQSDLDVKYNGMVHTLRTIWKEEGLSGLLSGIRPRMLFHSTAAAICWFTYEQMKKVLA